MLITVMNDTFRNDKAEEKDTVDGGRAFHMYHRKYHITTTKVSTVCLFAASR